MHFSRTNSRSEEINTDSYSAYRNLYFYFRLYTEMSVLKRLNGFIFLKRENLVMISCDGPISPFQQSCWADWQRFSIVASRDTSFRNNCFKIMDPSNLWGYILHLFPLFLFPFVQRILESCLWDCVCECRFRILGLKNISKYFLFLVQILNIDLATEKISTL